MQYKSIKELFTAIADKLRAKEGWIGNIPSQDIPMAIDLACQQQYANGWNEGESEGRQSGYENGFKVGYNEGERNGTQSGYESGYTEGEIVGREQGKEQGKTEVYAQIEPINAQLENTLNGTDTGGKSYYDEFWDAFQNFGKRGTYRYAFENCAFEYIRPKYKIAPTEKGGANTICIRSLMLKKVEAAYFDFSQLPYGTYAIDGFAYSFCECSKLEEIEDVGMKAVFSYEAAFAGCSSLHTIAKIAVDEKTLFTNAFNYCKSLQNLTIEGVIGQDGFNVQWSTKLSKASIISIINALSTTASGKSVTLSKVAVESAFGSTASEEWISLINARSNWTINLV